VADVVQHVVNVVLELLLVGLLSDDAVAKFFTLLSKALHFKFKIVDNQF
jgi:hypothetical protein